MNNQFTAQNWLHVIKTNPRPVAIAAGIVFALGLLVGLIIAGRYKTAGNGYILDAWTGRSVHASTGGFQ